MRRAVLCPRRRHLLFVAVPVVGALATTGRTVGSGTDQAQGAHRMNRAPRRPNVTVDEKGTLLGTIQIIQDDEPALSTRGYMYRIWKRGNIYLHGELCTKGHNEETIQGLVLEFRQGRLYPLGFGSG